MILADKIIRLRRKNGWSQEELAEKMQVSRQAVSKWEGAQTVPDLEKILALGELFGVTTDYLLKDEIEDEEFTDGDGGAPVKRVTLAQANEFLAWRRSASVRIAAAVFLCIGAVILLLLLGAAAEAPARYISEELAAGVGLTALLVSVAAAVAIFASCGFKNAPYDFIDKEPFETEYGVSGLVKERQRAYKPTYTRCCVIGACICILSPIPLLLGLFRAQDFFAVVMLTVTLALAGVGVVVFIVSGVRWASMEKLLQEGGVCPRRKEEEPGQGGGVHGVLADRHRHLSGLELPDRGLGDHLGGVARGRGFVRGGHLPVQAFRGPGAVNYTSQSETARSLRAVSFQPSNPPAQPEGLMVRIAPPSGCAGGGRYDVICGIQIPGRTYSRCRRPGRPAPPAAQRARTPGGPCRTSCGSRSRQS